MSVAIFFYDLYIIPTVRIISTYSYTYRAMYLNIILVKA